LEDEVLELRVLFAVNCHDDFVIRVRFGIEYLVLIESLAPNVKEIAQSECHGIVWLDVYLPCRIMGVNDPLARRAQAYLRGYRLLLSVYDNRQMRMYMQTVRNGTTCVYAWNFIRPGALLLGCLHA
jgi:hypothetical protein